MNRCCPIAAVAIAASAWLAFAGADKPLTSVEARADLKKLQGAWRIVAVHNAGEGDKERKVTRMTFRGNWIVFAFAGRTDTEQARFRIHPSEKPKRIDVEMRIFDARLWMKGIYALDRDALTLCFDRRGKKRPTKFDGSASSGCALVKLERVRK
jgi:uncharacterized protein (TIGR03067 family)